MAIVVPSNLEPYARPRVRGAFLVRPWRGLWIAAAWPRRRGPPTAWAQWWTSQQFAYAAKMAANPEPMSYETARFVTEGSHYLPRDVLTMVALGGFYEVYLPDGTLAPRADHGAPPPPAPPRPTVLNWQPNIIGGALAAAASTSAFAFKGCYFIPQVPMALSAVSAILTPVDGATYKAICCVLNGSHVIQSITNGTPRTLSGTTRMPYEFAISATLGVNDRIAIMIGRTSGANNYVLPTAIPSGTNFLIPAQEVGYSRIAQANPTAGQTVETGAGASQMSLLLDF